MRFELGQVYECVDNGKQAIVVQVRSEGREGLLRFADSSAEEWFISADFHQTGKWRLLGEDLSE